MATEEEVNVDIDAIDFLFLISNLILWLKTVYLCKLNQRRISFVPKTFCFHKIKKNIFLQLIASKVTLFAGNKGNYFKFPCENEVVSKSKTLLEI